MLACLQATPVDGGMLGAASLAAGSAGTTCLAPLYAPFRVSFTLHNVNHHLPPPGLAAGACCVDNAAVI